MLDAFKAADQVLLSGVQGITDLITTPGLINLDFADVKSVMSGAGSALMGIGSARGDDRAVAAAEMAISSPLLEASIDGAHGVLLSIQGGSDLGPVRDQRGRAARRPTRPRPDANIIFGAVIDDALGDEVRVTVIAAGFDEPGRPGRPRPRRRSRGRLRAGRPRPAAPAPAARGRQPAAALRPSARLARRPHSAGPRPGRARQAASAGAGGAAPPGPRRPRLGSRAASRSPSRPGGIGAGTRQAPVRRAGASPLRAAHVPAHRPTTTQAADAVPGPATAATPGTAAAAGDAGAAARS